MFVMINNAIGFPGFCTPVAHCRALRRDPVGDVRGAVVSFVVNGSIESTDGVGVSRQND